MRRHLFLLIILLLTAWCGNAQTMQGYEYWFDDGYSSKTAVTSSQPYVSFEADVSGLQAGLHYLNFRAQDVDGVWGALSRYIVYLTADSRGNSDMVAYEYWMDTDYSHRTSVKGSTVTSPFTVDVSNLQAGLHYFNFRAQCSDGQWGALSRYIVYLTADSRGNSDMVAYEYWMDTDYSHRTSVKGSTVTSPFTVDVSNLQAGLHYFNFRAQCSDGQWGALSRYIVYLTADSRGNSDMVAYEYWMDTDYSHRTSVKGSTVTSPFTVDVSDLQPGLHYFNFRAQCSDGHWGALSRYIVYISDAPASSNLAAVDYWIDSNPTKIQRQQVTDNTIVISADISKLPKGMHTFYVEGIASDGSRGMLNGYEFEVEAGDVEPYAALSENNTVLTFYCDDEKAIRDGMGIGPFDDSNARGWKDACQSITTVVFDESFANCTSITSTARWFDGCSNLTSISGINNLYTANVTSMRRMFKDCSSLTSIDVSHFNTENVTNMEYMFDGCSGLTILDVSGFNTENVTNMGSMFAGCSGLTTLDVTGFNTANVTDISRMFYTCSGLTTLDLSNFNTANAKEDMRHLFMNCFSLKTIYAGSGWTTDATTKGDEMFMNCTSLVGGAGTVYDENHTDHTYAHIDGGTSNPGYFTDKNAPVVTDPEPYAVLSENNTVLTFYYDEHKEERNGMSIAPSGASSWYYQRESITKVVFDDTFEDYTFLTSTANWFYGCNYLTEIVGLDKLRTPNVTNMDGMFCKCFNLTSLDLSNFNTSNVTNMEFMFQECSSLTSLDLSNFNTSNVKEMTSMFVSCSGLTSLDVSGFKTDNVVTMNSMFAGCSGLTSLDVSGFKTSNVTTMGSMFSGCSKLTTLDVSNFNTSNVTHMSGMFSGCSSLTSLDLSNFNTENVKDMSGMFSGCSGLTSLDLSNFNTSNVIYDTNDWYSGNGIRSMFEGCSALTTIWVSDGWTTANLTESPDVFKGCTSLVGGKGTHYDPDHIDYTYARIDGGPDSETPGYFTRKGDAPWVEPGTPEPYAVLSDNNTVLTFYYDNKKAERNGMSVGPFNGTSTRGWHENRDNITTVVFNETFAECHSLTSTRYWFYDMTRLENIEGIQNLKTENVTQMQQMFPNCSSLKTLDLSSFNTENVTEMHNMFYGCSSLSSLDLSSFNTSKVTHMGWMFQNCTSLITLNISSFNTSLVQNSEKIFADCSSLASIQVGNAEIPAEEYANIGNPNLLVYVNEARLAPEGVQNVVVNGVAKEIVLTDNPDGKIVNNNWYCPEPFRAEKISYTREFKQQTQIGISRGWESLALPFAVQTITHQDKGAIAPFGSDASGLHFWLRRLGHEGLISVQMIEPNTPYIISMPNSEDYASRFNLNGRVTFAAEDAYVERTEQMADESADYMMVPTFQRMPVSEYVYALNVGEERNGRPEGSIFERNYREVRPFEAYTLHRGDQPAPLFFDLSDLEGSTTDVPDVRWMMDDGNGEWYDLQGRKLGSTLNVQRSTLKKGVYIRNGRKTVVK